MHNAKLPDLKAQVLYGDIWGPTMSLGKVRKGDTFRMIEIDGSICCSKGLLKNTSEFVALANAELLPTGKYSVKAAGRVSNALTKN